MVASCSNGGVREKTNAAPVRSDDNGAPTSIKASETARDVPNSRQLVPDGTSLASSDPVVMSKM